MALGYASVTFTVTREGGTDDAYGGETDDTVVVQSGLTGILSYPSARSVQRLGGAPQGAQGPGGMNVTRAVLILEPAPTGSAIERDDVITLAGSTVPWKVVGVRDQYEYTLQLDLEVRQ